MKWVLRAHKTRSGLIHAPQWCPYKADRHGGLGTYNPIEENGLRDLVEASLCPLCKICTFVPIGEIDLPEITALERQAFIDYLMKEPKLASMISGQHAYLLKEDRIPLAVLISAQVLDGMLAASIPQENRRLFAHRCVITGEEPICHVLGCPVYFSPKLTRSLIQVVGEVAWR